ncbi:MAG: hypothetical protein Q4B84_03305 [Clostridia bacterium]|nr:hypothetical protein [Clostridia bacterium]
MGKSMRKFKKLAVLAITIPTLLISTNISFAMQNIRNANGPGSFSTIDRFFKINLSNTKYSLENLRKIYKHNYNIILSLNYIRSFITLYTKDGFKKVFNSEEVQEQMKKEAGERFTKITTNDESEILKVAVNVILYILDKNISELYSQQQQKDCWASIKYVVNELDTSKITKYFVNSKQEDPLYQFLLRGKHTIGNKGKGFAVKLIKKLQEQLNSEEYKCKYNGGNYSFGEFVFKNAIKVCTRDGSLPNFNTYSSDKVYAPITSQEQEQYKFDTVDNSPIEQENMETQNTLNPQRQTIHIPLNQLYLDGQGRVLFNPNVPYDNTSGFITILNDFIYNNIQDIYIVNGLRHDENGYIYNYNENECFTYANGQPVQLPLPQQQFEAIPSEQYHYNTVDNSPFEQENMETQNALNPQEQSICCIPLNQLSLDGQGNVLYNPTVPCDDTSVIIEIPKIFFARNCMEKIYVIGLFHDGNGCLFTGTEPLTYINGQPVKLPLQQQQFEAIPSEQYHYNSELCNDEDGFIPMLNDFTTTNIQNNC